MKNVFVIGINGIPACYGGFETLAENLVRFCPDNIHYTVFCSRKIYPSKYRKKTYLGATLKYINLSANGISSIPYDFLAMLRSLKSDFMLILGVSGCIFLPFIRLLYRGKIITHIDGIEWRRNKWNYIAKYILRLSEKMALKYSHRIIADNQGIIDYVYQVYNKKAVLIEYGADHVFKETL